MLINFNNVRTYISTNKNIPLQAFSNRIIVKLNHIHIQKNTSLWCWYQLSKFCNFMGKLLK